MWKEYKNGKIIGITHYKFDKPKTDFYTTKGKKVHCFLTYGLRSDWGSTRPCLLAQEKYRIQYVAVAGCVVNRNIIFKTSIHNFFVNSYQTIRYGYRWQKKMKDICVLEKSQNLN